MKNMDQEGLSSSASENEPNESDLTAREGDVFDLICRGKKTKKWLKYSVYR